MPWFERLAAILATGSGLRVVFQPIVDLATMRTVGYEALSRFPSPRRDDLSAVAPEVLDSNGLGVGPALWFAQASAHGLLHPLEARAARLALSRLPDVPAPLYVAVNVSPSTVLMPDFVPMLREHDLSRVVLEITETEPTPDDYGPLVAVLAPLRRNGACVGMRVAVDDVGAGASMAHVLALCADVVKVDVSVIRGIDTDHGKQALALGFANYARTIGAVTVAEGVETKSELAALRRLSVGLAQGYLLGRPEELSVREDA